MEKCCVLSEVGSGSLNKIFMTFDFRGLKYNLHFQRTANVTAVIQGRYRNQTTAKHEVRTIPTTPLISVSDGIRVKAS